MCAGHCACVHDSVCVWACVCVGMCMCVQAIALVYDVTDRESFENIANWTKQIEEVEHTRTNYHDMRMSERVCTFV